MSILWLNRPRKFIISHGHVKKTPISQQAAQAEAHRLEMEAVQAQRAAEAQRLQDMFSFMASLQALLGVVMPQSLLALVVASPPPVGTPVSIYGCLFL